MTEIKLKSHNDLDGVAPGILATLAFGEKVETTYHSYGNIDKAVSGHLRKPINKETTLFITDISVNPENEKELHQQYLDGKKIMLIDHHKTASHLNEYPWATVISEYPSNNKTSATSLFYEYLVESGSLYATPALDEFVELVRQYDTWEWEAKGNKKAKRLNDLFYIIGLASFEEQMLTRLTAEQQAFEFNEIETLILDMEEEKIERFIKTKQKQIKQFNIGKYVVGTVFAEQYHSETGNVLGQQNPHLDLIILVNSGSQKVSYRTIHDHVDVTKFAERYDGGGHPKSSGSALTEKAFREIVVAAYGADQVKADPEKNRFNVKASKYFTAYENANEEIFWIIREKDKWVLNKNLTMRSEEFETYEDAELSVKRDEGAWLSEDARLIESISKQHGFSNNKIRSHFDVVMKEIQKKENLGWLEIIKKSAKKGTGR